MAKFFASETALELSMECDAHTRRRRLHDGVSRRALLPRRAPDGDRRGDQRDPAPRHRPRAAGPRPGALSVPRSHLGQHLGGVGAEAGRRRGGAHRDVREADRAVDRPPHRAVGLVRSSRNPSVAASWGSTQDLGGSLRRRPPDTLTVEALGPLGQAALRDDLVEHGDDLRAMPAQRGGVGEAGVFVEVRAPEGAVHRLRRGGRPPAR